MDQSNLLKVFEEFNDKSRPRTIEGKTKTINILESVNAFYEGRELILNVFRSGMFPKEETQGKELKILTPKQMLQGLPIALAQVKAGNTSADLLNEIIQLIYSLYWTTKITEKVYNNKMNSIKV